MGVDIKTLAALISAVTVMGGIGMGVERFNTRMDELIGTVEQLAEDVRLLKAPTQIAVWSPATRFAGPCRRGATCILVSRARRVEGALECRIIPDRTRFMATSMADYVTRSLMAVDMRRDGRNYSATFQESEIEIMVPPSMALGRAEVIVEVEYEGCTWQRQGMPAVRQISPPISMEVVE